MKRSLLPFVLVFIALAVCAYGQKPNIIVIVADDIGVGDIGRQHTERTGNPPIAPTPNIDSLADGGMWFTDAHSPAALCAPSRYAFMTGNYTYRSTHPGGTWGAFWQSAIQPSDMTLGRITKAAGYNTGFIGKWHLGGGFYKPGTTTYFRGNDGGATPSQVDLSTWISGGPQDMGFDYDFTITTGVQGPVYVAHENASWYRFDAANSSLVYLDSSNALEAIFVSDKGPGVGDSHWNARALNMMLADKAAAFITANAPSSDPFFLYYCSPAVHLPWTPPTSIDGTPIAGTTGENHLDMVRVLDFEVKRIVDALQASGEYDNTLILFTSDNGGLGNYSVHKSNGGYVSGYKNSQKEGGTLVPFIAVWPDVIQANTYCNSLINGTDILATLAAVVEQPFTDDQAMDSYNLLPIFTTSITYEPRDELLYQAGTGNQLIIRQDKWKLIMSPITGNYNNASRSTYQASNLYNLATDPYEGSNLVSNPSYTARVAAMFDRYWDLREAGTRTAPSSDTPVVIPDPDIIHVDQATGNIANSGTSWSEALPTITDALAQAGTGEHIWVASGTYSEGGTLNIPSGSTIYGGFANGQTSVDDRDFGSNETVINGSTVQVLNASNIRFDGFTVTGVSGDWASALKIDTSTGGADVDEITIANCRIAGNTLGPAVVLVRGWQGQSVFDVDFENCEISGNNSTRDYTGVINANAIQGKLTVRNCSFHSNTVAIPITAASGAGLSVSGGGDLLVESSLFHGNLNQNANESTCIQTTGGGAVKIVNSTFGNAAAGTAGGSGLVRVDDGSAIEIYNCIFAGSPREALINNRTAQTTMSDCIFYNNTGNHIGGTDTANTESAINALSWASGCSVSNPSFSGTTDFALTVGSPAIDAGADNKLSAEATVDMAGEPRVAGLHVDIGAYEIQDQDGDNLPDSYEMANTTPQSPVTLDAGSDGDSDGLNALAEYALGLSSLEPNSHEAFTHSITDDGGQKFLSLSYRRNRSAEGDASFTVQRSTTLTSGTSWVAGQTVITGTVPDPVDTDVDIITERSQFPTTSQPREFLRLKVDFAP